MSLEVWIIDGWNLYFSLSERHKNLTSPLSKDTYFSLLADFAAIQHRMLHVILDGRCPTDELKPFQTKQLNLDYSSRLSADRVIERLIYESNAKNQLVVVTDDRAIAQNGRGAGVRVISTDEFKLLLDETKNEKKSFLLKKEGKTHGFSRPFGDKL